MALAQGATVVPVTRSLLADGLTPVMAAAKLGIGRRPVAPEEAGEGMSNDGGFLLESVVGGEKWARYSFVGTAPPLIVTGAGRTYGRRGPGFAEVREDVDPWEELRREMARYRPAAVPGLPRFWGGAVGYVSYDAVRAFEPTVTRRDIEAPVEFCLGIGGDVLVFDNLRQTVDLVVPALVQGDADAAYDRAVLRLDELAARLDQPAPLRQRPMPVAAVVPPPLPPSSFDRRGYAAAVECAKEHIRAGDIFQVVLSQRFRVPDDDVDLLEVYRTMRVVNPSPYMFLLQFADVAVVGASPETLVRFEQGLAEVRPIAGTRPRGRDEAEDAALAVELVRDPKEVAEHVMLVDLGRNDLGRISKPGTVTITERMCVERYSHVMHIVSNVRGEVADGRDALDVLRATFPAGTLSGAPKVRAMQIIDELEPEPRGIYGGAVGYLGYDGNLDVAIAIRSVVAREGELWLQAGAGIVEASDPDREYEETLNKARAGLVSIEHARRFARGD